MEEKSIPVDQDEKPEMNGLNPEKLDGDAVEESGDKTEDSTTDDDAFPESVTLGRLFSHTDGIDVLLMILGGIGAAGSGVAQPVSFIIFGKLIEKFIDFGKGNMTNIDMQDVKNANLNDLGIDLEGEMKQFAIYYVIIAAAMFVCGFAQAGFWSMTALRQIHRIRKKFFHSLLKQDIGWFDLNESGGLLSRLSDDLIKIQAGLGDKVGLVIYSIFLCLGGFIVGFVYSWKLSLVILATTPALAAVGALFGKVISNMSSEEQKAYSAAAAVATEVLGSIRTVAAFGGEFEEIDRYESKLHIAEAAGIKKAGLLGGSMGITYLVMFASYALGFWYGSQLVAEGEISGGEMLIVFFSILMGGFQIGAVAPNWQAVTTARGAAHFVYSVIDQEPIINGITDEGTKLADVFGDISLENIDFRYPSRKEVQILQGFNLNVKSGTTVALVGESGCGKSTIVKLVQRFYDPEAGDVKLDGVSIKGLNLKWLRTNIGVVNQEPVLFEMSIAENIKLGEGAPVTQTEIENAAKNANAHDFIMALPKQYDTYVGEGGAQLSGGQKQRVAIARALVRDPKILLFDEATSALDTESEGIVQAALDKASEGRTTIIIAHRLSTIRNADMIVAVKDGNVVETGTHEELMEKKRFYYQLVLLQTMVEEEDVDVLDLPEEDKVVVVKEKLMRTLSTKSEEVEEIDEEIVSQLVSQYSLRRRKRTETLTSDTPKKDMENTSKEEAETIEPAPYMRILKYSTSEWPYFLSGTFFAMILGAFPLVFAIVLSKLLAEFVFSPESIKSQSKYYAWYFFGLGVIEGVAFPAAALLFGKAGEILTKRLRKLTFKALLRQEVGFFDDPKNSTSQIGARLATDASNVQAATGTRFSNMTQIGVITITSLVVGFVYSWKLTLLILAFTPILFLAGAAQMKLFGDFAAEEGKRLVTANALASQSIMNIRTVASLGKEEYFVNKFNEYIEGPYKTSTKRSVGFGASFGLSSSVMMLANAAGFVLGGKLVQDGELEFEEMFIVFMAIMFGAITAGQIASMAPDFVQAKISAARIFQLLDRVPSIDGFSTEGNTLDAEKVQGDINFKDIEFHYPTRPGVKVLKNMSLNIKSGQKVALVGASGCGKSTTIGLLERFYDPIAGSIYLDNYNTKEFNIRWMRSILGLVSQEPVLFARSIKDNIAYGLKPKPSQDEIQTAARNANIHSFISTLPKGYDTMVGEKGTLISGGQKQRIAIARALIRNPKIMLLDEATSALDSESERVVQDALDAAMEGRTSIIIAHRLSTIQNADVIVVIQNGIIVEMGTHQELMAQHGAYYQLNKTQVTS